MKVVLEPSTGMLLGFHFCGPGASEAAQMGAMALGAGLTVRELRATMPLHPTIAEELIGLGEPDDALRPQGNMPVVEAEASGARARRVRAA
jgi:glutathione reductase (NADPH)